MKNIIPVLIIQITSLRGALEMNITRGRMVPMQRCESITIIQSRKVFLSCFKIIFTIDPLREIMSKHTKSDATCNDNELHSFLTRTCSTSLNLRYSVLFPTVMIIPLSSKVESRMVWKGTKQILLSVEFIMLLWIFLRIYKNVMLGLIQNQR